MGINSDVTNVTGVTSNNINDSNITEGSNDNITGVINKSKIPDISECPCFKVFDSWYESDGFKFRPGVWYFSSKIDKKGIPLTMEKRWVCSPVYVDAIASDSQEQNFGRLLRYRNSLGNWNSFSMPMELLKGSGEELRGILLSIGVEIDPRAKSLLAIYLQSQHPKRLVNCALQVGWYDGCYVLPDTVIGKNSFDIIFQSGEIFNDEYSCKGNVEGWRNEIAKYAVGNHVFTTALSTAFAGPLLKICGVESGGVHFVGNSATGKTGLIEAACSVWGGESHKRSWRATSNGMEGVATMFNDGLLALDEISECDPREVSAIVYALGNGVGKQRATRNGNARSVKRWQCSVLSSGERTVETTMLEANIKIKAGQTVRLVSVPVERNYGVWDNIYHCENGAIFTDMIKSASKKHYGLAGREFLEKLTIDERDFNSEIELIKSLYSCLTGRSEGQIKRVISRFAMIAFAGELATEYGLTGWNKGDATAALSITLSEWLKTKPNNENEEKNKVFEQLSSFIERHGDSRFSGILEQSNSPTIHNRAGWWRDESMSRIYLFNKDGMREALKGFDFTTALNVLKKAEVLKCYDSSGSHSKPTWVGKRQVRLYEIHSKNLTI